LAARNVLVSKSETGKILLKIADFGLSFFSNKPKSNFTAVNTPVMKTTTFSNLK
jgi:serine/threonine protein kinase